MIFPCGLRTRKLFASSRQALGVRLFPITKTSDECSLEGAQPENLEKPAPILRPILPDADEEHAAAAAINKSVARNQSSQECLEFVP